MNGTARIVRRTLAALHSEAKLLRSGEFDLKTISRLIVEIRVRWLQVTYEITNRFPNNYQ